MGNWFLNATETPVKLEQILVVKLKPVHLHSVDFLVSILSYSMFTWDHQTAGFPYGLLLQGISWKKRVFCMTETFGELLNLISLAMFNLRRLFRHPAVMGQCEWLKPLRVSRTKSVLVQLCIIQYCFFPQKSRHSENLSPPHLAFILSSHTVLIKMTNKFTQQCQCSPLSETLLKYCRNINAVM